jgi:hypothetical protein
MAEEKKLCSLSYYNVADAVVQDLLQNHGNVDKFLLEAPDKEFLTMEVNYNPSFLLFSLPNFSSL